MARRGVMFHAPPANHSRENGGDICDTEDWEKILDVLKYFSLNICLGWRTLLFVREGDTMQIEISDPGRMSANQRPFLGQLTNERPGKGSKIVTVVHSLCYLCLWAGNLSSNAENTGNRHHSHSLIVWMWPLGDHRFYYRSSQEIEMSQLSQ